MKTNWKEEFSKIEGKRVAIFIGLVGFVFGLVQGTVEGGLSLGLLQAFMMPIGLGAVYAFFYGCWAVLLMGVNTLIELFNQSPKLQEYTLKILRWFQRPW